MLLERFQREAVDVIGPSESVLIAAQRMHHRGVGSLIVVDNLNLPIGIVTDRDVMARVVAGGLDPGTTAVREVMTAPVQVARPNTSLQSLMALMENGRFRRVPLVNELGHLVGIVTLDDVLLVLCEQLAIAKRIVEKETPRAAVLNA